MQHIYSILIQHHPNFTQLILLHLESWSRFLLYGKISNASRIYRAHHSSLRLFS